MFIGFVKENGSPGSTPASLFTNVENFFVDNSLNSAVFDPKNAIATTAVSFFLPSEIFETQCSEEKFF